MKASVHVPSQYCTVLQCNFISSRRRDRMFISGAEHKLGGCSTRQDGAALDVLYRGSAPLALRALRLNFWTLHRACSCSSSRAAARRGRTSKVNFTLSVGSNKKRCARGGHAAVCRAGPASALSACDNEQTRPQAATAAQRGHSAGDRARC